MAETARPVFDLDQLATKERDFLVTRMREGTMRPKSWPGVTIYYEGLPQPCVTLALAAGGGDMNVVYPELARMGWTAIQLDGEDAKGNPLPIEAMDCDFHTIGINRDVLCRTIKTKDWERIPFVIAKEIGERVWDASHQTYADRHVLAFTTPSVETPAGAATASSNPDKSADSPLDAPPATEGGVSRSDSSTATASATPSPAAVAPSADSTSRKRATSTPAGQRNGTATTSRSRRGNSKA